MSKSRVKKCSSCGDEKRIVKGWSTRFPKCQHCVWTEDPPRSKAKKKVSSKLKSDREKDWEVGRKIWAERPHYCVETGEYLGTVLRKVYLSHLLSKGAHPELRHDPRNIVLHSASAHQRWEFGKNRHETKTYRDYLPIMIEMGFVPKE